MKTTQQLASAFAALLLIGTTYAQTAPAVASPPHDAAPGVLGKSIAELNYSWVDFSRDHDINADGFILGVDTNTPVSPGWDFGLGYNYFRENKHRNPFNGSQFDARYHRLSSAITWYSPMAGFTPYITGGIGYQWSHGDIQSLRTYDNMWLWSLGFGAEIPLGRFALTPHVGYTDGFDTNSTGTWNYGGELNTWFTDKVGGFVDVTYHQPRHSWQTDALTYTAGVRFRF